MEKIMCGNGAVFYTNCSDSLRVRELLLQFQFNPTLSNAEALLNNKDVEQYCDALADSCLLECPCFEVSMKKRITRLRNAEAKPGGLCAAALYEKALFVSLGWWE